MAARLTFWFEFASTYSYLAAERLRALGEVPPRTSWRAFLLGPIFEDMGLATSPFVAWPAKGAYMWRDLERLCAARGLPFRRPETFPQNGLLAARVATAHTAAPWLADFVCAVYRAQFGQGRDIGDRNVVAEAMRAVGVDADAALHAADAATTKTALREATDGARRHGLFGAPSFTIGDEIFWGQDRLDDAVRWRGS